MVTAIGAIIQMTNQRAELVRFYREKLGLDDPDQGEGQQFFMVGDLRLAIVSSPSSDAKARGPVPRTGLSFVVDDLEAQVARMKGQGVPFDLEPTQEVGGARVAVCRDPDGNFVTLMAGPRRDRLPQAAIRPKVSKARLPAPEIRASTAKVRSKAPARKRR